MLRITIYKNTIFSNEYKQVLNTKRINNNPSILDLYLNLRDKLSYEIDQVYQENGGTFIFDTTVLGEPYDIYNYNYMKVETLDENENVMLERFCFIDTIVIKNELVYLSYSEDIWHSYSNKITGIAKSYLDRTRVTTYGDEMIRPIFLPVSYDGNQKITIRDICNINKNGDGTTGNGKCNCIIEIQRYNTAQQGEITARDTSYYFLSIDLDGSSFEFDQEYEQIVFFINLLIQMSSDAYMIKGTSTRYEIGNIYIFPSSFNLNQYASSTYATFTSSSFQTASKIRCYEITDDATLKLGASFTITHNYKNLSIGTFSTQIPVISNGTNFDCNIYFSKTMGDIFIGLNLLNGIYDITDNFSYQATVAPLNSNELSLLKMEKDVRVSSLKTQLDIISTKQSSLVGTTVGTIVANQGNMISSSFGQNAFQLAGSALAYAGNNVVNLAVNTNSNFTIMGLQTKQIKKELELAQAPLYTSSKGIFANNSSFINATLGIILLRITSDNDDFVQQSIKENGFKCFKYISDLDEIKFFDTNYFNSKQYTFNYIKFLDISVYGSFPQNIASALNAIFNSGFKIWYRQTLQEDNH